MDAPTPSPFLTVDEAARFLRIGRAQAYEAVKRGDLPAVRIGRSLRIHRQDLESLPRGAR